MVVGGCCQGGGDGVQDDFNNVRVGPNLCGLFLLVNTQQPSTRDCSPSFRGRWAATRPKYEFGPSACARHFWSGSSNQLAPSPAWWGRAATGAGHLLSATASPGEAVIGECAEARGKHVKEKERRINSAAVNFIGFDPSLEVQLSAELDEPRALR